MNNGNLLILVLAVVVVAEIVIVARSRNSWTSNSVKVVGLTITAFLAIITALTVDNDNALAPSYGLLGAISGYLVGKNDE